MQQRIDLANSLVDKSCRKSVILKFLIGSVVQILVCTSFLKGQELSLSGEPTVD